MTRKTKTNAPNRIRAEIVEMAGDLNAAGLMSDGDLEKITMRMLNKNKLPKVESLTGPEIRRMRERAGLSQAVFAHYLNLTVSYVSQLERGEKHPRGATAKLLDIIRRNGFEAIM